MDRRLRYHCDLDATFARNKNYERITVTPCMHILEMCACESGATRTTWKLIDEQTPLRLYSYYGVIVLHTIYTHVYTNANL